MGSEMCIRDRFKVVRVNGIEANEILSITVPWQTENVDRIRVVVDSENVIPEVNDEDNTAEHSVTIAYAEYLGWFDSIREQPLAWIFVLLSILTLSVVFTVASKTSIDYGDGAFDEEEDWEDDDDEDLDYSDDDDDESND